MTDNLALAKSVGAVVVEGGVLFVGYEQLEKYTQAATAQGNRQPLTDEQRRWIVAVCPTPAKIIDAVEAAHEIKA